MSTDRAALAALQTQTKQELRFFELVTLRFSAQTQQCFLCVGKHCVYLVRRNVDGLYPSDKGGQIYYAHIEQLVEDTQSGSDLVIVMNENRPTEWQSEKLFVVSEHRMRLIEHVTVAWQTDYAWRFGKVGSLPLNQQALRRSPQPGILKVQPFKNYQLQIYEGYTFFIKDSYRSESTSMSGYGNGVWFDDDRELELRLKVDETEHLGDLDAFGRDHIRWVAAEYRAGVTVNLNHVLLVNNQFYMKRMNLVNDISSWTGWEILMKSESLVIATIFLRRQYVPPLLDCAQDFCISITCPSHSLNEGIVTETELLHEARMVADSCSPLVHNCTEHQQIYRRMVQAKLDTLLVNEDALVWLEVSLGMTPMYQVLAKTFLKSILKILQDENELKTPDLIHQIGEELVIRPDPMVLPRELLSTITGSNDLKSSDPIVNSAYARIARYLAHCVDGGLLEQRFTLFDLTEPTMVNGPSQQKINEIIYFLLHMRSKDMTQPFDKTYGFRHHLHDSNFFTEYTFNDKVMQSLLELGWISKELPSGHAVEQDRRSRKGSSMSIDYVKFLAQLLISSTSSANLKAAICRQIIAANGQDVHHATILPALMELLNQHSLYLRTYGTVTLVNMSGGQEIVRNAIMMWEEHVIPLILESLRSQDDDLIQYTLALLTNLTRSVQHRHIVMKYGVLVMVLELLGSMRFNLTKHSILAELTSVIGQLCNDDEMWNDMCKPVHNTVDRLLDIFHGAPAGSRLRSKVMFALKQICARPSWRHDGEEKSNPKEKVGEVIERVVKEELIRVMRVSKGEDLDCAANAILLLGTLTILQDNVRRMQALKIEVRDEFKAFSGHLADGDDIYSGLMTLEEAKLKCETEFHGCKGFMLRGYSAGIGDRHNEKYEILMKSRWHFVEARGYTSFKYDIRAVPKGLKHQDGKTKIMTIDEILSRLLESELGDMDSTRDRLTQLTLRVAPRAAAKIAAKKSDEGAPSNQEVPVAKSSSAKSAIQKARHGMAAITSMGTKGSSASANR